MNIILAQTSQFTYDSQFWFGVVQTIAVIFSLFFVCIQIRDGTKSVRSQTYQSIISSYAEIEARIGQDSETARVYYLGCKYPNELKTEVEKIRFRQIICSIFNFFENLHYQYKSGLLEAALWAGWCNLMRQKLEDPGVKEYWHAAKNLYSKDFCDYVDSGKCPKN